MSNLYQESTGVTAVTADGQPVGLMLDKSRGNVLGDELVTNGTFDTDISDWSAGTGITLSHGSGTLLVDYTSVSILGAYQVFTTEVGKTYVASAEVVSLTGSSGEDNLLRVGSGSAPDSGIGDSESYTGAGVRTVTFKATTTSSYVYLRAANNQGVVEWDNISVKEVLGNHALQPVSTKRPTYNSNPDRLTLDLVDDGLLVTIPTGGWDGYMTIGTDQGTASYGVSLPEGDYELGGDYFPGNTINQVLFREGDIDATSLERLEQKFVDDGAKASYGDVTDFSSYWRDKSITEFPVVDTSSGTSFSSAWRDNNLTEFPLIDTSSGTSFSQAWRDNSLTSFPLIDTSNGTNFSFAWIYNSLTSFPLIDTSSGTNFAYAWNVNNLTSFPLIDTSNGTNFSFTWRDNDLTEFPLINTSNGLYFSYAWYGNNLTSFPLIDTSKGIDFSNAWRGNNLTSFPPIDTPNGTNFSFAWRDNDLTEFPLIDTSSGTNFSNAWTSNNLTSFPLIDTSNGTDFGYAWFANNLTSFPLIDTSNGTSFAGAWTSNSLTSFPLINTSKGTNFGSAWQLNNLASFPLIDTSSGTNFGGSWQGNNLTSFPALDFSSGTNFERAWLSNDNLTDFPANMFDNCLCTNFTQAFTSTSLSQSSIDGILVSINSNGTSGGIFDQSGGSAPSATGEAAIDAMRSRGWTITVTGGY